jgi:glyoxylase-like metal-dependent hydrolase (beta-lactamase superfamily II)
MVRVQARQLEYSSIYSPPVTDLRLADQDVIGIRADNPGPFSLSGTNSWIVGRDPAWLIDPGPQLTEHLDALDAELARRGGLGGMAVTHDHLDHVGGLPEMRARHPDARVGGARANVDVRLGDGDRFGPLEVLALPGHAPDHLVFLSHGVAFTGDAVLGQGSVFIAPDPGALSAYLAGLERLRRRHPALICPAHGPVVKDPEAKLSEYIAHRLDRERRLLAALAEGQRTVDALLDSVWSDAPAALRPAAAVTLAAHLDKLADEGRLPAGVERPSGWPSAAG